jgi:hypothetical protein
MNNISFQMMGGLGNLLFPLATAYSLSKKNNLDLKLFYNHIGYLHTHPDKYKNNIFKFFKEINSISEYEIVQQEKFEYYSIEIPINKNIFLNGYFQSEKNFIDCKNDLLQKLGPSKEKIEELSLLYPSISEDKTVSIHIRRGTYLQLQENHPCLKKEYYEKALNEFIDHKIFIFSDDILFCKSEFKGKKYIFVENNFDLDDLYLMSLCKNNIIANSTFSWWGAWLNKNDNKKIFAPKKWFGPNLQFNSIDIIPENWIRI